MVWKKEENPASGWGCIPKPSVAFHIETSHLNYFANPMTGFYMKWVDNKRIKKMP